MRYLVLSDIHGGGAELARALTFFERLRCDFIVLLGDLLNHGPRNRVPSSYAPPEVAELLNARRELILSVRGNCDSEVDSMVFAFPCNAPYGFIVQPVPGGAQRIFLTHGHLHRIDTAEDLQRLGLTERDIVLSGHTHVSGIFKKPSGIVNVNPGSTTLPKGATESGFGLIDESGISLYTLEGREIAREPFRNAN